MSTPTNIRQQDAAPSNEPQGSLPLATCSKGAPLTPENENEGEGEDRDMIELRIYLDGWLRKMVAATGLLIALMAIGAYVLQLIRK